MLLFYLLIIEYNIPREFISVFYALLHSVYIHLKCFRDLLLHYPNIFMFKIIANPLRPYLFTDKSVVTNATI